MEEVKDETLQSQQPGDSQSAATPEQPSSTPHVEPPVEKPKPQNPPAQTSRTQRSQTQQGPPSPPVRQPKPRKPKTVVIIADGFWGTQLLRSGDSSSDPEYLALVGDPRKAVRVVEWENADD